MSGGTIGKPTTLGYSSLTGTVYVLLRNGQKREVPRAEVAAVIAGFLTDHDLTVAGERYGLLPAGSSASGTPRTEEGAG